MHNRLALVCSRVGLTLGVALLAGAAHTEDPAPIRIRPEPIGAAKKLTSARGDESAELPVDGLVPARLPEVAARATLSTLEPIKSVSTIGDFSTISTTRPLTTALPGTTSTPSTTTTASGTTSTVTATATVIEPLSPDLSSTLEPATREQLLKSGSLTTIDRTRVLDGGLIVSGPTIGSGTGTNTGTTPVAGTGGTAGVPSGESTTPSQPSAGSEADAAAEKQKRERLPPEAIAEVVVERLQLLAQIREERLAREALEAQQRERVDGPSALGAVNLLEGLHVDAQISLDLGDILRVEHELYQDGNAKSGRFYYLPARYDLAWDPEHQYALTVIYGNAESEGGEGQILMAARLQSGVDTRELEIVRELLRAYVRRHAKEREIRFESLLPFALAGTTDVSLFGGAKNEFSIPRDQISVQGASELLGAIDVSWAADQRRLLNVESLLRTKAGIHGQIGLLGAGSAKLARALPLSIDVASPRTFGRIAFERERGFRNATRYPLRLRTLHALVLARKGKGRVREGDPVVYSWDLHDTRVPPGAAVAWEAEDVPEWLDARSLVQWVDYGVEGKCEACDELVFDEKFIPSAAATRPVVMTASDVFAATGAARLAVRIRSRHLTPARELAALPQVLITEDGAPKTVARLFVTDGELATDAPLYEYQLELTWPDGRSFAGASWTATRSLDLLLGSESVRELVGMPPAPPPAPSSP
jgi:hypothetical protein